MVSGRHKTGGGGGPWIEFDSPKPPRVTDHYDTSLEGSGIVSDRCQWWIRQINRGWRPNRRTLRCCWDCNSEWMGIYGWEYIEYIWPLLWPPPEPKPVYLGPPTLEEWLKSEMLEMFEIELLKQVLYGDGS